MALAAMIVYKLAEADKRRGWLWAGMTVVCILLLTQVLKLGMLGIYVGFVIPIALMFAAKSTGRL